jgi:putative nucleotidyltransferase with HDIG domain
VERLFDITTGMTLIELRDPKHPLLRELQLRAPGTYNHSLTVASIAESAAEAIGADGLLTYVGCLYHDIGKMNKPDYFVENQSPGVNKHDKLSPAMSLLLVVGHVKDGLELARDFNIPRPLHHFIESHHGTTLVEFFFHRARERALSAMRESGAGEGDLSEGGDPALIGEERMEFNEPQVPDEFAFRYPGPKPQSREAAILMVCDAVESATRTLSDPTPARIDALVRSIANKRLMDGQFEDCEITLRDLHLIVESVSRSVASIYHARIAYPGPSTRTAEAARA